MCYLYVDALVEDWYFHVIDKVMFDFFINEYLSNQCIVENHDYGIYKWTTTALYYNVYYLCGTMGPWVKVPKPSRKTPRLWCIGLVLPLGFSP